MHKLFILVNQIAKTLEINAPVKLTPELEHSATDSWTIFECNAICLWQLIKDCLPDEPCTYDSDGNPSCVSKPKFSPPPTNTCTLPSGSTDCSKGWCEPIKDENGNVIQVLSCFSDESINACVCKQLCGSIMNSANCSTLGWCPYSLPCMPADSPSTGSLTGTSCQCGN